MRLPASCCTSTPRSSVASTAWANHGYLLKRGDGTFTTSDGRIGVPPDQVVEAMHQNPNERHRFWHAYSVAQVETCIELAQLLVSGYGLRDIVGHDDIAPSRKVDLGPAFPLRSIASRAFGRDQDQNAPQALFVGAAKLNIRAGAGTEFPPVRAPLPLNTVVRPLGSLQGIWLQVEASVAPPNVGWVRSEYLRAAAS